MLRGLPGRELDVARQQRDAAAAVGAEVARGRDGERVALEGDGVERERAHDFLWRIHQEVPAAGEIVVSGEGPRLGSTLRFDDLPAAPDLDVRLAGDAHAPRNFDAATAEGALVGAAIG